MDNCIFCKLIKGEIPKFTVYEDEEFLAFLTIAPIKEGHTLIIPKKHTDYFFDLPNEELSTLMVKAKEVADKLKITFKPNSGKVGVIVAGLEMPHVHLHLIPLDSEYDLNFTHQHQAMPEELQLVLDKINNA